MFVGLSVALALDFPETQKVETKMGTEGENDAQLIEFTTESMEHKATER